MIGFRREGDSDIRGGGGEGPDKARVALYAWLLDVIVFYVINRRSG